MKKQYTFGLGSVFSLIVVFFINKQRKAKKL